MIRLEHVAIQITREDGKCLVARPIAGKGAAEGKRNTRTVSK